MNQLRRAGYFFAFAHLLAFFFAACDDGNELEGICEPGTNVFCRCPGGDAGTRPCLDSGEDFGECVIAPGIACGDRVECEAFTTIPCLCPGGDDGVKECLREGTGYGACTLPNGSACPDPSPTSTGPGGGGGVGGGGNMPTCSHGVCELGDALQPGCGSCEDSVCAVDDYCCTTAWDGACVALADDECDNVCNPIVACEHDLCVAGEALSDGCDPCVSSVCAADDFCCGAVVDSIPGSWDATCVGFVKDGSAHPACTGLCCAHSECLEGGKLTADCSLCAAEVCALDAYCCNNQWDEVCVDLAEAEPACNCL